VISKEHLAINTIIQYWHIYNFIYLSWHSFSIVTFATCVDILALLFMQQTVASECAILASYSSQSYVDIPLFNYVQCILLEETFWSHKYATMYVIP